ncbi:MAG TPA: hypothetical protein ENJ18_11705 [Nannocystis exedens]|nr:hypothetical protein [Nannocystis exedens]
MSLWSRFFRRFRPLVIDGFDDLIEHDLSAGSLVEICGEVEAVETIIDPIAGIECVAIDYGAWPQSTTAGIDGAAPSNSRAFQLTCHQAVDFVLLRGGLRLLVRVDRGRDVGELHHQLLERYGLGLRSDAQSIVGGDRVRITASIERLRNAGSPHRSDPYLAVVAAQQIWRVTEH